MLCDVITFKCFNDVTELKVAKTDVLDVGVLVDSVSRSLPSETRFFNTTECGLGCADDALIHADHAHLEGVDVKLNMLKQN